MPYCTLAWIFFVQKVMPRGFDVGEIHHLVKSRSDHYAAILTRFHPNSSYHAGKETLTLLLTKKIWVLVFENDANESF